MVILLDLNAPMESVSDPPWDDTPLDTIMLIAAPRKPVRTAREPAPATPPDDLALATWEDAEWQ